MVTGNQGRVYGIQDIWESVRYIRSENWPSDSSCISLPWQLGSVEILLYNHSHHTEKGKRVEIVEK